MLALAGRSNVEERWPRHDRARRWLSSATELARSDSCTDLVQLRMRIDVHEVLEDGSEWRLHLLQGMSRRLGHGRRE